MVSKDTYLNIKTFLTIHSDTCDDDFESEIDFKKLKRYSVLRQEDGF